MKKPDETVYEEVTTTQNERIIPGRARRSISYAAKPNESEMAFGAPC